VLGLTEVDSSGTRVELGGPLPRRLVTALVAADGQTVPDGRLAEAVWGPNGMRRGSTAALQVYVSRLRRVLGTEGRERLERTATGYRLRLAPDATDVARFAQYLEKGRRLLAQGRAETALAVLTEALELWRGDAYEDLPTSEFVAGARSRLVELREVAVDERLAAQLATGDAQGAVSELDAAVAASPYRERRWALLILGLYRSGRQGEALARLGRVRELLADELGIDPGAELRELERRVLAQDPTLLWPEPARPAEPGSAYAPAPAGPAYGRPLSSFVGRERELESVATALHGHRLVTVTGPGGVGKTRLAVEHIAARWAQDGPWLARLANARGPDDVVRAVAAAVGLPDVPGDPRAALVRAVAPRPGLLVLDNCEHVVDAVALLALELLHGCADLRVLVTSREPLGIDGERVVPLGPLPVVAEDGSDGPAVALLLDRVRAVRAGWQPSEEEREGARRVCAALDGLPLALELAAARARVLGLAEIAERLDDRFAVLGTVPRGSLAPHATLRAAIGWSVEHLDKPDRALLMRLWPFDDGFSLAEAEAVHAGGKSMIDSLSSLVTRSVVIADTTRRPTRYRLLETVRAYCREHDPDPSGSLEAHARRVLGGREPALGTTLGLR